MQKVHVFACAKFTSFVYVTPELARLRRVHAPALKPTHKAGGVAGIALRAEAGIYFIFPAPERIPVALLWSWVSNEAKRRRRVVALRALCAEGVKPPRRAAVGGVTRRRRDYIFRSG